MKLIDRRIREGHYEYRCVTCGDWYISLAAHLRLRLHRLTRGRVMAKLILNAPYGKMAQQ